MPSVIIMIMERFVIEEGGRPLEGKVKVGGAKNSVLTLMAAAILADTPSVIERVPRLLDLEVMIRVLEHLGCRCRFISSHVLEVDPTECDRWTAPYELVRRMRASFFVLGPLLARFGRARVSMPGGCSIGIRSVNYHLEGMKALGAEVTLDEGYVQAEADRLEGAEIHLDFPSVGATENLLMAAVKAHGRTVIMNAAQEPEVVDLCNFLTRMGARIEGAGTHEIVVEGVDRLEGVRYEVIGDRIETGTFMLAAATTRGRVEIEGGTPLFLESLIAKLRSCGVKVEHEGDTIVVEGTESPRGVNVTTLPYPGFSTDLQAPMMSFLCTCEGRSMVTETLFENRFMHVAELNRMGASISMKSTSTAIVEGPASLVGAEVMASDLRAGAALVIAALAARGRSVVNRIYHIDRGYERFEEKLAALGARIRRDRAE